MKILYKIDIDKAPLNFYKNGYSRNYYYFHGHFFGYGEKNLLERKICRIVTAKGNAKNG